MEQRIDGLADIIPPIPAHDGLAALLAPSPTVIGGWWLFIFAVTLLLGLLLAVFLLRRQLLARLRLWQAERALHSHRPASEIAAQIALLLRWHHRINILHCAQPPDSVDAEVWHKLLTALHAAQFGGKALDLNALHPLLKQTFISSVDKR